MQDNTIQDKVKVFISSKCGGRYTVVRKALKALLLESNMTKVYVFETTGASSQNVISSYIYHLDDSDICIFLIDNADGIPDAVLVEHKRARELGKKSIYIFCDENQKQPTQLQKEITESLREKFAVIHEFSDFIERAYQDVIQDITNIYRLYCRGQLSDKKTYTETDSIFKYFDTYKIDKKLFKGFDLTKNAFIKIIYPIKNEIKESSELDEICEQLFQVVIGNSTINTFDFELLKIKLCETHEDFLKEFLISRINAIKAYFNNDLENCLSELNSLYDKTILNKKIPNWLLNDVLIDMRNTEFLIDETKNQYKLKNRGQKLLDENNESVYYPLLDRYIVNFNEEVLKKHLSSNTDSPYTTSFGGLEVVFKNIAGAFIVSVMYGSLTQLLITRERLIEALSSFCFIYRDHSMYIQLLKMLLMCQKDKEIKKIIRAYNQTTEMINENDIAYLLKGINTISIAHKRAISKFILFKHFGYHFSEELYIKISDELLSETERWIYNDNRLFALSSYVFSALINNIHRINNEKVLATINTLFEKRLKRWFDDALKVIRVINFSSVSEEMEIKIVNQLVALISDQEIREKCNYLSETLIHVRRHMKSKTDVIDASVKENMEHFYQSNYSLEIFEKDKNNALKHITSFIQTIYQQNQEQGNNGTYHGYLGNPYQTIRNIIEYDDLNLKWADIKPIINAIENTMFAPKQTVGAKSSALQLLVYLKNKFGASKKVNSIFDKFISNQEEILSGFEDGVFDKDSIMTLKFNFLMLKVSFGKYNIDELLSNIAISAQQNDYEIIRSLECIENLLYNIDFKKLEKSALTVIAQYAISMSSHKEKHARYYSLKILFLLCRSSLKSPALLQLSKMMDNDIYEIKAAILSSINKINTDNEEIVKYINQKGRIDNHFLVRKIARDMVIES